MKYLSLIPLCLLVCGCKHSEYDVTPDQIAKKLPQHGGGPGPGGLDLKHLPPGAVKEEHTYKKGDVLPDGTIADSDRHIVKVKMSGPAPGPGGGGQLETEDVRVEGKL